MEFHDVSNLGEEPVYCNTHDDDILYSGSEDDYYERPEDRRMRIEAKAVQYLNGNVPYILSAGLRGPFDAKSWDNPWRSKRAQRHAAARRGSQSRPSTNTAKVARSLAPAKATFNSDLPDTQRTSLFPLPSPEITNPPSARTNHFLAEEEFSRIKTWRETVKKVPLSKDPFWASFQNASQRSLVSKKRSGDQDWLHKREPKKRKSEDMMSLSQDQSPSQNAAKIRGSQVTGWIADKVARSAPGSATHRAELSARPSGKTASFDASRMVNMAVDPPDKPRTARKQPLMTKRASVQASGSSCNELFMPIATPSDPAKLPLGPGSNGRASSQKKAEVKGPATRTRSSQAHKKAEVTGPTTRSRSSQAHEAQLDVDMTTHDPASHSVRRRKDKENVNSGFTNDAEKHGPAQKVKKKFLAQEALGASQRDDSFHFHTARPKQCSPQHELFPADQMDETTLGLFQSPPAPVVASEAPKQKGNDVSCGEDKDGPDPAAPNDQMRVDLNNDHDAPIESNREATVADLDKMMANVVDTVEVPSEPHGADTLDDVGNEPQEDAARAEQSRNDRHTICTNIGPDRSKEDCTQELSPVSMQRQPQAAASASDAISSAAAVPLQAHDADTSNPDWSTYVNTQDISTASEQPSAAAEHTDFKSEDAVDPDDPEWTTFVTTQNTATPGTEADMIPENMDGVHVVVQGPDDSSDPEWSTFANTQDLTTTQAQLDGTPVVKDEPVAEYDEETRFGTDATESESELSFLSMSSDDDAEHTGNTSSEPVLVDAPAAESKNSQDTLGGIIDGYAASDRSMDDFEDCPESQDPIVQHAGMAMPQQPDVEERVQFDAHVEENTTAQTTTSQDGPASNATMDPSDSLVNTAETPAYPTAKAPRASNEPYVSPGEPSAIDFDGTTASFLSQYPPNDLTSVQSPWAKSVTDVPLPVVVSTDTPAMNGISRLSSLAGEALAFSPAPQTPWLGDRLPSPNFSLSVKRFSDFMKPSPEKKRASANGSILRSSARDNTSRVLFETPVPVKADRHVQFAPLPGEDDALLSTLESKGKENLIEEDVSYFDAKGVKTASMRITRSHTRATSPPPANINIADADDLSDRDDKFASHFEAVSKRAQDPPLKKQRLLPSESQQTNGSQAADAMAEAFIQASQTRQKSLELMEALKENSRLSEPSPDKIFSPAAVDPVGEPAVYMDEPIDDVSAVLDNIDDFLDNSWGFNTSMNVEEEAPAKQPPSMVPSRFAHVGDPMLTMHANVWAD